MEHSLPRRKFDPVTGDSQGCPSGEPGPVSCAQTPLYSCDSLRSITRMHPYLAQQDLLDFCNEKGIHITAYSPTGKSPSPSDVMMKYMMVAFRSCCRSRGSCDKRLGGEVQCDRHADHTWVGPCPRCQYCYQELKRVAQKTYFERPFLRRPVPFPHCTEGVSRSSQTWTQKM